MSRIISVAEEQGMDRIPPLGSRPSTKTGAVTFAAAEVAELLDAKCMVAFTQSGDSAKRMARLRSSIPLIVFTPDPAVRSQLSLLWGANPAETIQLQTGRWAFKFLLLTLAITPVRRLTGWNVLIQYRRMLGLFAFCYATLHFTSYIVLDQ